jgi:hypothetical protein
MGDLSSDTRYFRSGSEVGVLIARKVIRAERSAFLIATVTEPADHLVQECEQWRKKSIS